MARLTQSQVALLQWRGRSVWQLAGAEEKLRVLWCVEHRSGGQIAAALNLEYGVALTREAVLGRVRRLGLVGKGGTQKPLVQPWAQKPPPKSVTLAAGYRWDGGRVHLDSGAAV